MAHLRLQPDGWPVTFFTDQFFLSSYNDDGLECSFFLSTNRFLAAFCNCCDHTQSFFFYCSLFCSAVVSVIFVRFAFMLLIINESRWRSLMCSLLYLLLIADRSANPCQCMQPSMDSHLPPIHRHFKYCCCSHMNM
jgi:hypothetical protein